MKRIKILLPACLLFAAIIVIPGILSPSGHKEPLTGQELPAGPVKFSKDFALMLEQINLAHKSIQKPEIPPEKTLLETYAPKPVNTVLEYKPSASTGIWELLSAEQAENDIHTLFYYLRSEYGLYDYYGGETAFSAAEEALLSYCKEAETITKTDFQNLILEKLSFIRDCHFMVGGITPTRLVFPYYYTEIAFEKTKDGYQSIQEKKKVAAVEGCDNWEELFRPSLSSEGTLVYYPVVLKEMAQNADISGFVPEDIRIFYEDRSDIWLSSAPYGYGFRPERADVELYKNQGIPVLYSRKMGFDEAGDKDAQAFLEYAAQLLDSPVIILDLRANGGGNMALPYKWLNLYTGEYAAGNTFSLDYEQAKASAASRSRFVSEETLITYMGRKPLGEKLVLYGNQQKPWLENQNLLIVLTSKATASSSEAMLDLLYNMENVLIIGDPTAGAFLGEGTYELKLPNSLLTVSFGDSRRFFPEGDYFSEGRGFFPDIWVSAEKAEELAVAFILKNLARK